VWVIKRVVAEEVNAVFPESGGYSRKLPHFPQDAIYSPISPIPHIGGMPYLLAQSYVFKEKKNKKN
jgi:hypothetical protein